MTTNATPDIDVNSPEMAFNLIKGGLGQGAARLGRLALPGRRPVETPNFIAMASRGTIPHITPDNISKNTSIGAAYMALEDFIETNQSPIYQMPVAEGSRRLQTFSAFPKDVATVMAPRRVEPVPTSVGNGSKYLSLWTSRGYVQLPITAYASAVETLRPDIAILPGDLLHTSKSPPSKKLLRMAERTEDWSALFLAPEQLQKFRDLGVSLFAPVLAVPYPVQWEYLNHLVESHQGTSALTGLAIYSVDLMQDLAENYQPLDSLARLSLDVPATPQEIVRQISAGVDICTVPFLNSVSDAGVALTFTFPPPAPMQEPGARVPLGWDMWSSDNVASLSPLMEGCQCYACTKHHRAFLHHLLNAKEMLGWTLLQIHNHHVLSEFFADVRRVLREAPESFADLAAQFETVYEAEVPKGTGNRPRARGYHFKSQAGQEKVNETQWENYNKVDDTTNTPLAPDEDGQTLDRKGFAAKTV